MNDIKFPAQMVWTPEDAHKAVQEYIQMLIDKISKLETEIKEMQLYDC